MAKPWKAATAICMVVTVFAAIGLVLGSVTGNVLWPILLLLPAAAYEAYRTGGESTRWASWVLLVLLVATVVLILFDVSYDLRQLLSQKEAIVAEHLVPFGDVKTVMPALMAICAVILILRTRGRYTRWLAAVIFFSSLAIVYMMDPEVISTFMRAIVQRAT